MYQGLPAKGDVSWLKTVELAADQKSDPYRLEILKIQKIWIYTKKIKIKNFLRASKNVYNWQPLKVNNYREALIKQK